MTFPFTELSWIPLQSAAHEGEGAMGMGLHGALQADGVQIQLTVAAWKYECGLV